jgi:hypothetical protein
MTPLLHQQVYCMGMSRGIRTMPKSRYMGLEDFFLSGGIDLSSRGSYMHMPPITGRLVSRAGTRSTTTASEASEPPSGRTPLGAAVGVDDGGPSTLSESSGVEASGLDGPEATE